MTLFYTLLCIIIFILVPIYVFFHESFTYWASKKIPHLQPQLPYGNFHNIGKNTHLSELLQTIYKTFKGKTPFAGVYCFTNPDIVIIDLKLVKNILIKDFTYFKNRGSYLCEKNNPLSRNLLTLSGPTWNCLHHKLSPTLSAIKMKDLFTTAVNVAKEFQQCLTELMQITNKKRRIHIRNHNNDEELEEELELNKMLERFITDIIGRCVYGIQNCNSFHKPNSEFFQMIKQIFMNKEPSIHVEDMVTSFYHKIVKSVFHFNKYDETITNYFKNIIEKTIENRKCSSDNNNSTDYLDLLIEIKNSDEKHKFIEHKLTTDEIAAHIYLFCLAGFESMNALMTFTLYELSINLDIQNMARNEIKNVLKQYNGDFTYEALINMKYIDQILLESVRKYPPIVTIIRNANKEYNVPGTNKIIENNSKVMIPVYAIHHDPEYYPDPDKFDPDRFTPENIAQRPDMSFLGYGHGLRNCIGLNFGQMITKIGIITLIKNFIITPGLKTPKPPLKFSPTRVVLTPECSLSLKFKKIQN